MKNYVSEQEASLLDRVIPQNSPKDLAQFWQDAVAEMRAVPLRVKREKLRTPYDKYISTWELRINTHDATELVAWFSVPAGAKEKLPCVVNFHGGSLSKILHHDIVTTGVCCLDMDVRGQGGESVDRAEYPMGGLNGSLMTRGLLDRNSFYMRNIYLDAIRMMDVAASLPEVDPGRIVTYGGSQGGALSIVASAFSGHSKKCYTYVTSYCCIRQRVEKGTGMFKSVNEYLRKFPDATDKVMENLSYFDTRNLVSFLKVPTDFCIGLADEICLPHFVYSVYHHAACPKTLMMLPFVPHCEPPTFRDRARFEFATM